MSDDDTPQAFELLFWGPHHAKLFARAKPPPQVTLRSGPAGVSLRIGFDVPPDFMTQLLDRFERAHREGGIDAGLLPDRPLSVAQLRDEWIRAQRTKHVALPLAKKRPLYGPDGDVGWFFDDN